MSTGPRRIGKYELHDRLGRGGMAEVWKAWDTQLERYVAIKFLHTDMRTDPNFMSRFVREAQAIASLHHPNIVQVHDFQVTEPPVSEESLAYMVMNYIEGPTLAQYIAQTSRLGKIPSWASITYLFTAIGRAIDYAHQRGMIHRDIKPANILLDSQNTSRHPVGEPILTDFGIVKLLGTAGTTLAGVMLGTPFYMSPEQAQGQPGNERSDIYSLGVILYEVCTGVRPFQGETPTAIIVQHITSMPTPPNLINPSLSPAVTEVILRCLAKDPAARFPSALSLTTALSAAFNATPLLPSSQSWPASPNTQDGSNDKGPTPSLPSAALPHLEGPLPGSQSVESPAPAGSSFPLGSEQAIAQQLPRPSSLTPVFASTGQHALAMTSVSTAMEPVQLPVPPSPKKRRRAILAGLIIILLVVVVAASTGTYYLLTRNGPRSVSSSSVGTIAFVSSGKYSQINNLGVEDELQISLHNLAPPAAGKAYYAWLLGDNGASQTPPLLLGNGQLPVNNGTLDYLHPYDGQHNILLAHYSRFLITAEDANRIPTTPSSNSSAWRYYTEIPQTANTSIDSSTVLYELRTLLSGKPDDPTQWTIGGLVPRLVKSIESVQTLIDGARESWNSKNSTMLRQQIVSVLYYLDGTTNVQTDVSPAQKHTPIDEILAGTPLLDLSQGQGAMSYFLVTRNRLGILLTSPGISPTIKTGAQQALDALPDTQNWLRMMHDDAKNLLSMDDTALLQPSANSILSNMATEAHNAYDGPSTGTAKSGAMFIYTTVQSLLIFDVQACTKPSGEWRCASTSA